MPKEIVKTRFAPSPTGRLHVGGARTALYNWLYARQMGGQFVLRIEDTDFERSKTEYEDEIYEALRYLGLDWDEGPDIGGPQGPYRQSERIALYRSILEGLKTKGMVYPCYCSEFELRAQKAKATEQKMAYRYDRRCAQLDASERADLERQGITPCWRLHAPQDEIVFEDLVHGFIHFSVREIGDIVVMRSNGIATYNFAVAIDDWTMGITHVMRADEHVSNTPKQLLVYRALGVTPPKFGHFSMILGPNGAKLSKRHGSTAVMEYIHEGYLPDGLNNYLALLGWSPKNVRETYSLPELRVVFSLSGMAHSPGVFDAGKLLWMSGWHIRQLSRADLLDKSLPFLSKAGVLTPDLRSPSSGERFSREYVVGALALEQKRIKRLGEVADLLHHFFVDQPAYPTEMLTKKVTVEAAKRSLEEAISLLENWTEAQNTPVADAFRDATLRREDDTKLHLWPVRVALSGHDASPGCFELIEALGHPRALKRLRHALEKLTFGELKGLETPEVILLETASKQNIHDTLRP